MNPHENMSGVNKDEDKTADTSDQEDPIFFKVIDKDGNEVWFRMKRSTQLKRLMYAYCDRVSVKLDTACFMFRGCRLLQNQTPDQLEMEVGEEIDVLPAMGGPDLQVLQYVFARIHTKIEVWDEEHIANICLSFPMKRSTQLKKLINAYCDRNSSEPDDVVFLFRGRNIPVEQTPYEVRRLFHLTLMQDQNETFFRMKRTTQLRRLMNAYCERLSVDPNTVVFMFDGHRVEAERTPRELQMEDGDEMEALLSV